MARRAAFPQPAGRFPWWWQVLGSNQRRLSRRFTDRSCLHLHIAINLCKQHRVLVACDDAVRYVSVPADSQPPDRTDSHGHRPRSAPDLPRPDHRPRPGPSRVRQPGRPSVMSCHREHSVAVLFPARYMPVPYHATSSPQVSAGTCPDSGLAAWWLSCPRRYYLFCVCGSPIDQAARLSSRQGLRMEVSGSAGWRVCRVWGTNRTSSQTSTEPARIPA